MKDIKSAFTMAEVLITLAIIGIIAALTIPSMMANYKKRVIVTRMMKFNSVLSQATNMIKAETGDENILEEWGEIFDGDRAEEWFLKYFKKHLKYDKYTKYSDGLLVKLYDGSGFTLHQSHVTFCPEYKDCVAALKKYNNSTRELYVNGMDGKTTFAFYLSSDGDNVYKVCWDGTREGAINNNPDSCKYGGQYGCAGSTHKLCAKLIEIDGWKIKEDYPVKF